MSTSKSNKFLVKTAGIFHAFGDLLGAVEQWKAAGEAMIEDWEECLEEGKTQGRSRK